MEKKKIKPQETIQCMCEPILLVHLWSYSRAAQAG